MLLIDLQQSRSIDDSESKSQLANVRRYRQWIERLRLKLESLPTQKLDDTPYKTASLLNRQQAFGWTQEDFKFVLQPMAANGEEARSEEHTSELQSLMRISYAVFCLKKKK